MPTLALAITLDEAMICPNLDSDRMANIVSRHNPAIPAKPTTHTWKMAGVTFSQY